MTLDLSTKMELMAKDVEYLKGEVGEIKQLLKEHTIEESQMWDKVFKAIDTKMETKANVWVEKAFSWGLYTVAGVLLLALLGLIIKVSITNGSL